MKHSHAFLNCPVIAGCLLITTGPEANAQSFQLNDFILPIGVPFYSQALTGAAPMDTIPGSGETWNYATLQTVLDQDGGVVAIAPADVPVLGMYPQTAIAWRRPVDMGLEESYTLFDQQADGIHFLGYYAAADDYTEYSDPQLQFAPMDLGDTLFDPFCAEDVFPEGGPLATCGNMAISFSSMGTLQLPYGSFPGTRLLTRRATIWQIKAPDEPYDLLTQDWYIPGSPQPVLHSLYLIQDGNILYQTGTMLTEATVQSIGIREEATAAQFTCTPNPATDHITIQRDATGSADLVVRSADGRVVMQDRISSGSAVHTFDITGLSIGPYCIEMVAGSGKSSQKFIKH